MAILILIFITSLALVFYLRFRKQYKRFNEIPGPKCSKILGSVFGNLEILWWIRPLDDIMYSGFLVLIGLTKIYYDGGTGIFRAWLGPLHNVVVLYTAETVEPLLSSNLHIEKSREYKFFRPWLGLGLLTSTGDRWRTHRKLLTPSFHFRILENFVPVINGQQKIMNDIIDNKIVENDGIIDDIRPVITNCALDTICETAMGVTVNAQTDLDSDYVKSIRNVLMLFWERLIRPWMWTDIVYFNTRWGHEFKANTSILHEFTNSVIKERKTELLKKMAESRDHDLQEAVNDIGSKRRLAFLDSLLVHHIANPNEFTEQDIREEVDTFMFEGHDTTSAALQFALFLIGHDQGVQLKIHEEMDEIFVDDMSREITLEDLKNMKYTEQCIKEALRLYPSVPYIARQNHEPLTVGEYEVPKNTTCLALFYSLHRDPKYYPNPEVFDPKRFDSDASGQRHPYAYVPFSAGPRNCIGQKFALLEEKAFLASILRRYRIQSLTPRDELKLDIAAILKAKSDIRMRFEKRF